MNSETIVTIITTIGTIVFGFLSAYLKTKSNLLNNAQSAIVNAEEEYKDATQAGGQKFEYAVDLLYNLVPSPLRIIFTRDMIGVIVQAAFDKIQEFATHQLDKLTDKISDKNEKSSEEIEDGE